MDRRLIEEGIQCGPLTISFQRFQRPVGGIIREAPPSLGALPVGENNRGEWLLPVADEEAWILLFEPGSTLNTGNVENEMTLHELDRV